MKRTFPRSRLRNIIKSYQKDGKLSKNVDILVSEVIISLVDFSLGICHSLYVTTDLHILLVDVLGLYDVSSQACC